MKKYSFLLLSFTIFLVNCKNPSTENKIETEVNSETSNSSRMDYCFRNEFPFPDSKDKDVQELFISVEGNSATGEYNWLPAFKDKREGDIKGTITGNTITAEYSFIQEGIRDSAEITIRIQDENAVITGGDPQLGLAATIKKINCNN